MTVKVALTVAGLDPSGGAGVAADLKTFHQHGVYGCAVVSLITAQNTQRIRRVERMSADLVAEQLDTLLEDITPDAAKTGALGSVEVVAVVARRLRDARVPFVVDPVRIAKQSDAELLDARARRVVLDELVAGAGLLTVNAPEAEWLTERPVRDEADAHAAAERLEALGARAVLLKGGHLAGDRCVDILRTAGTSFRYDAPRLLAAHSHGIGCTLAASIAARLALGTPLPAACAQAKAWVSRALGSAPGVGHGIGSLNHFAPL